MKIYRIPYENPCRTGVRNLSLMRAGDIPAVINLQYVPSLSGWADFAPAHKNYSSQV